MVTYFSILAIAVLAWFGFQIDEWRAERKRRNRPDS
jgi:hypothetical protein